MERGLELHKNKQEHDQRSDAPRRASLGRELMRAVAMVPRQGRKEARIDGGEESDKNYEKDRRDEENPVDLFLGGFDGGFVGEPPGGAEEDEDDGEEEEDRIWKRIEGERIDD